jgi:hypothetical protein
VKKLKLSAIAWTLYRYLRPIIERELVRLAVQWIRDNQDRIIEKIASLGGS